MHMVIFLLKYLNQNKNTYAQFEHAINNRFIGYLKYGKKGYSYL